MTKAFINDQCHRYKSGYDFNDEKYCDERGNYHSDVIELAIESFDYGDMKVVGQKNKLEIHIEARISGTNNIDELITDKSFIGALYLYKAEGCNNHWVTLLPVDDSFAVIDSEDIYSKGVQQVRGRQLTSHFVGEILESPQEVKQYFQTFIGLISCHFHLLGN